MKIQIEVNEIVLEGELKDSLLGEKVEALIPFHSNGRVWGQELYFPIPLKSQLSKPQDLMEVGDIAFWTEGSCLCLFYGPTPISSENEIRAASAVEVVGKFRGDLDGLKKITSPCEIKVKAG